MIWIKSVICNECWLVSFWATFTCAEQLRLWAFVWISNFWTFETELLMVPVYMTETMKWIYTHQFKLVLTGSEVYQVRKLKLQTNPSPNKEIWWKEQLQSQKSQWPQLKSYIIPKLWFLQHIFTPNLIQRGRSAPIPSYNIPFSHPILESKDRNVCRGPDYKAYLFDVNM